MYVNGWTYLRTRYYSAYIYYCCFCVSYIHAYIYISPRDAHRRLKSKYSAPFSCLRLMREVTAATTIVRA